MKKNFLQVDRWKEEVRIQEAKAASHNSRLRTEVEAHCETRDQLDKTIKHLAETRCLSKETLSNFLTNWMKSLSFLGLKLRQHEKSAKSLWIK